MRITTTIIAIAIAVCVIGLLAAAGLRPSGVQAGPPAQAAVPDPATPTPTPAAVQSIAFSGNPSGSHYIARQRIRATVRFDRAVTVTGRPQLEFAIGTQQRTARYARGSGSQNLEFSYRIKSNDYDSDGVSVPAGSINLNGGTIQSADGVAVNLAHPGIPTDSTRKVQGSPDTQPTFGSATIRDETYSKGAAITSVTLPIATGTNTPLTYSLTPLPDGLTFTAATHLLSGTPTAGQTATTYTYTVTDADGDTATLSFTIAITADYDADDDQLLEVDNLAQLDAIRYDLDGNGAVDTGIAAAGIAKYAAAFPNPVNDGMGCKLVDHDDDTATPKEPVCTGYELTQNLDFDTDGDGATYSVSATGVVTGDADDAYYNGGLGWTPLGTGTAAFTATFDGDGKTISNLFINRTGVSPPLGLFSYIGAGGTVKKLGLPKVSITYNGAGRRMIGTLAGHNRGTVADCYAAGSFTVDSAAGSGGLIVGGLIGHLLISGKISDSYAAVAVSSKGGLAKDFSWNRVGGLVGRHSGAGAAITASYATGAVSVGNYARAGGLVGTMNRDAAITASYATGAVSGSDRGMIGGLVGFSGYIGSSIIASYATGAVTGGSHIGAGGLVGNLHSDGRVTASYAIGIVSGGASSDLHGLSGSTATNSYWNTGASGQSSGGSGVGKTTRELQSPTGYTGIYADWNLDLDNADGDDNTATGADDLWDFGTARQYPAVKHNGKLVPGQRQTSIQSDHWNAPLVGEPVTAGMNVTGAASIVWQWQSSADGATWTNIAGATTATYIPVAADAASGGKFLRAQATFTVSGQSQTLTTVNTAKVLAANTATAGTAATVLVMVGKPLHYHHAAVTAAATANRTGWQWMRCDDAAMTTNCQLAQSSPATYAYAEYTPAAGTDSDVGKYLRAHAYYADSGNSNAWTRTQTPVLGPVLSVPAPVVIPSP